MLVIVPTFDTVFSVIRWLGWGEGYFFLQAVGKFCLQRSYSPTVSIVLAVMR